MNQRKIVVKLRMQVIIPHTTGDTPQETNHGGCRACTGKCSVSQATSQPSAPDGGHPKNSLRQAGEILLKMAAGQYPDTEEKGLWEVLDSLLRSYAAGKGVGNG